MEPELVHAILDCVRNHWIIANDIEITLEANPTSVEAARFHGYRTAGVNRLSLGVQALNDTDLKRLGRLHSVSEARSALDLARDTFDRVSFDLIYARQDQTLSDWQAELTWALDHAADHLSLYQLTIEPDTAFGDRFQRGRLGGLPGEDLSGDMYFATQELCEAAGLPAYEISNHARPGAESRHNLIYWRGGDYAGIGPGAHGRLTLDGTRLATDTPKAPLIWLQQVEKTGNGEAPRTNLTLKDQVSEYLMMGLRLREGIDLTQLAALGDINMNKIKWLEEIGMIEKTGDTLRTTANGRPVLNAILTELLPD